MTIVILVLFECFKVVYNNNNNEELCVNVCRGRENSSKDFDSTEVRAHGELSAADFQLFLFHEFMELSPPSSVARTLLRRGRS